MLDLLLFGLVRLFDALMSFIARKLGIALSFIGVAGLGIILAGESGGPVQTYDSFAGGIWGAIAVSSTFTFFGFLLVFFAERKRFEGGEAWFHSENDPWVRIQNESTDLTPPTEIADADARRRSKMTPEEAAWDDHLREQAASTR